MAAPRFSLLEGDIAPLLRRLTVPMIFGMLSIAIFNVADTYFISHLGTRELAALGFTLPVTNFVLGIAYGMGVGTASVISRVYGEGNFDKVKQMSTDALVMALLVSLSAAAAGALTIDIVFPLMGADAALMPVIREYMLVWYLSLPLFCLMIVGNSCMRALGDTGYASMIMTLTSVLSLLFDPLLIFGWGPFPRLGMTGAAATLCIAYALTAGFSLYSLVRRKHALSPVIWHDGMRQAWRRFMHVALPSIFSNQIAPISAAIITWMAAGYGKEAVAALGVASRVEGVCVLIFYAIAAGVSVFSGQNYGAGNYGRIAEACRIAMRTAMCVGLAMTVILWPFAADIPALFEDNPQVIAYTAQYLHWVPISFGAMGALVIVNAALNAMGKPLAATVLVVLRMFVIYVPLAYVLQQYYGFLGIVVALMLTNLLAGGASVLARRWFIR